MVFRSCPGFTSVIICVHFLQLIGWSINWKRSMLCSFSCHFQSNALKCNICDWMIMLHQHVFTISLIAFNDLNIRSTGCRITDLSNCDNPTIDNDIIYLYIYIYILPFTHALTRYNFSFYKRVFEIMIHIRRMELAKTIVLVCFDVPFVWY